MGLSSLVGEGSRCLSESHENSLWNSSFISMQERIAHTSGAGRGRGCAGSPSAPQIRESGLPPRITNCSRVGLNVDLAGA
jgi:hypothetical protein